MRFVGNGGPETIGQRLRRLRVERGLSQRELSSPGVSYAYISRIEAGSRQPSVKALRMLARKLGISADYLETGSEMRDVEARELRLANAELELRLAEDPGAPEQTLREVLDEAVAAGDRSSASRARIALGLSAAAQGRPAEAVELLEQGLAESPLLPCTRPDVFGTLGRCYAALGRPERAVELFEECIRSVDEHTPDDVAARVRFTTYLSFALTDMGDLRRAQEVLTDVLDDADTISDPYTRVRLYWSLGRLTGYQAQPAAALDYIRRAIALLEATDDTVHLARAHVTHAWTLLSDNRAQEAGAHLEAAERLFGAHPLPADLASLRTEQAKRAGMLGNGDEAVRRARESLELLGDNDPGEQGAAWLALAQGLVLQGDVDAADDAYRRSVEKLESARKRQEAAQACRAWARLLRGTGREADALDVLERATDLAVSGTPVETRDG